MGNSTQHILGFWEWYLLDFMEDMTSTPKPISVLFRQRWSRDCIQSWKISLDLCRQRGTQHLCGMLPHQGTDLDRENGTSREAPFW